MAGDLERRVRVRAYEIWEREGRPPGMEAEHWERARQEIEAEGYGREAPSEATEPKDLPPKGRAARRSEGDAKAS